MKQRAFHLGVLKYRAIILIVSLSALDRVSGCFFIYTNLIYATSLPSPKKTGCKGCQVTAIQHISR